MRCVISDVIVDLPGLELLKDTDDYSAVFSVQHNNSVSPTVLDLFVKVDERWLIQLPI